ncbi:MAG: ATP-binding protein [bacterium]|nr:ATP-binding protein [bacterium]
MKRRISLQYSIIVLCALVAFIIGSSQLVRANLNKVTELNLRNYLQIVQTDYQRGTTNQLLINKYINVNSFLRITIIAPDGQVIIDSLAVELENHADRPEILQLNTVHIRYSNTLEKQMMYIATQLSDQNYLRVAIPQSSVLPFLNDFIGLSIIVAAIIITIAVFFIVGLVHLNLKPLLAMEASLQQVASGGYAETLPLEKDEELNKVIVKINEVNRIISENLQSLSLEKEKNDFILDQMGQGLAVLDESGKVVLINRFIRDLFGLKQITDWKQEYRYVFRENSIHQTIEQAFLQKGYVTSFFEKLTKYYSVSATFLETAWTGRACVLLLFNDVTTIKDVEVTKRDFFANASHELKSPLTSIIGASELITSGFTKTPEDVSDLAGRILQEAKRMNRLVLDMLALSKYENVLLHRGTHPVDFVLLAEDVKQRLGPYALERHITISTILSSVIMQGDYEHLFELLHNLVENSIKYGIEGGYVNIRIHKQLDQILIEVEDNGIGIPKSEQTRVFERFYRVDKSRSQKISGTGLGLSIVKHIVMLYQGEIQMTSSVNVGTKITIQLPL